MDWLRYLFSIVGVVVSLLAVYEGVQLLALNGRSRRAVVTLTVGVVCCIAWAAINYAKFHVLTDTLTILQGKKLETPPREEWSPSLTAEQAEDIGLMVARHEYHRSGTLTSYEDRNKMTKQFSPSQTEVNEREQFVANLAEIRLLAEARRSDAVALCLWAIFAAMFGYYSGRKLRHER